jgi:hypothetical protein
MLKIRKADRPMVTPVQIVDESVAVFLCSRCKQMVRIEVMDFVMQPAHQFDMACSCGHLNRTVIEYRRTIRKETHIPGIYKITDADGKEKTGSMTVKNISWQGFKLKISGYEHCIKEHDLDCNRHMRENHDSRSIFVQNYLKTGDRIIIEFFLDDPKMSFISRPVAIKWIRRDHMGVELCYPDNFEPSIRFYLLGLKTT